MIKSIIKEIIIFLLLLLSIGLLLGIVFYDYIPNTKIIPSKVPPYELSEDIEEEIASAEAEGQNIIKTYSIGSSDLNLYKNTGRYKNGKRNPFETTLVENTTDNTTNTNSSSNTNNNTNTNINTNSSTNNDVGNYFEDEGK